MVRLEKLDATLEGWAAKIERCLPDRRMFWTLARRFERLTLNGKKRRAGFKKYVGDLFVTCGGDFPPAWREMEVVKAALLKMTQGHCAYCQKCLERDAPVDHFRPKALFPTLAYDLGNYLLSCTACNRNKSDKWPPEGSYVRPDEGDPAARFAFDERGRVRAMPGDVEAKATVKDLRLNRRWIRLHRRGGVERQVAIVRRYLDAFGDDVEHCRAVVRPLLMPPLSPFSEAINQNVRHAWEERFPGEPL